MKKLLIVAALLAVAIALGSCNKDDEKGGTIEVTNEYVVTAGPLSSGVPVKVSIKKGILPDTNPSTEIAAGGKKIFTVDEDGTYSVYATTSGVALPVLTTTVSVSGGGMAKVTIKK
jgi:hypothetical protein